MNAETPEEKYSLLFTLPKSTHTLFVVYFVLALSVTLINVNLKIISRYYGIALFAIYLLQPYIIKYFGSTSVPYSSMRRVISLEIVGLIPTLIGSILTLFSQKEAYLYIFLALSSSFRLIAYYGVFFDKIFPAIFFSFLPISPIVFYHTRIINLVIQAFFILLSAFLLIKLDNISKNEIGEKTTSLFKYFMAAWVSEYPLFLERFLERNSEKVKTKVYSIIFKGSKSTRVIVPYLHPGPFKPIGSYNLPYEFKKNFPEENVIVLHAPVDHKYNIPSHLELKRLFKIVKEDGIIKEEGSKVSNLKQINSKNFKILTWNLSNKYKFVVIIPKTPSEDFPSHFSDRILMNEKIILVDAHNNLGSKPNSDKIKEVEKLLGDLPSNLKLEKELLFGFSHIEPWNSEDIGPGGADCLTVAVNNDIFSFVVFDANNMKSGIALKMMQELRNRFKKISMVVILTTDSHFNAAKISVEKGYKALGEDTPYDNLMKICVELINKSLKNLEPAKIRIIENDVEISIMGEKILSYINKILDRSLRFFKIMWLIILSLILTSLFGFTLVNI